MRPRSHRLAAPLGAALLVLPLASACGREAGTDLANGKTKFVERCGSCHVLDRAGTTGVQGPNLDQAFGPARGQGFNQRTVEGVVKRQIAFVRKNSTMPPNLVKGEDASDVAAYVAYVAGEPGKDTGLLASAGAPDTANKTTTAKGNKLAIDAVESGALRFAAGKAVANAGALMFSMKNPSPVQHNIALQGGKAGPVVGTGGTSSFTADLKPGKYTYLCTVPGHADGGMKGILTVK